MKEVDALIKRLRATPSNWGAVGGKEAAEIVGLCLSILQITVGTSHSLLQKIADWDVGQSDPSGAVGYKAAIIGLYESGALADIRSKIAAEIEDDFLDIAENQLTEAKKSPPSNASFHLAVAAFLCGGVLEDALRRLCDKHGLTYDPTKSKISSLRQLLYQPNNGIEHITRTETKHIDAWGDVRNNADHKHWGKLNVTDVETMISGVRAFIAKHLSGL